jgi:integrase
VLGYSKKDKLTDNSANLMLVKYKEEIELGYNPNETIKLDKLFNMYVATLKDTDWTKNKIRIYNRYIKDPVGNKQIEKIKKMDIDKILKDLYSRGLSPRTQKTILEVLKPCFNFAIDNKIMKENPIKNITVKVPNQKKIVTNASELFKKVYEGIKIYYKDESFYQALFLFGFTGRRKAEILNLKWDNIDFISDYYWIEDTKNDDKQKYPLPPYIKDQLLSIEDDKKGLVFKSPVTGKKIVNIDRQMRQLKKFIEIDELSLHYMRNILVSALAEQKTEAIVLSGILGHKDVNTINKYLSINHYKSGEIGLNKIGKII